MTCSHYLSAFRAKLIKLAPYRSVMRGDDVSLFDSLCVHFFCFVSPIIRTDMDCLDDLDNLLQKYDD